MEEIKIDASLADIVATISEVLRKITMYQERNLVELDYMGKVEELASMMDELELMKYHLSSYAGVLALKGV